MRREGIAKSKFNNFMNVSLKLRSRIFGYLVCMLRSCECYERCYDPYIHLTNISVVQCRLYAPWNESKYPISRARAASEIRRKFRRRLRSSRSFRFREETSRIRIILLARTPSTWLWGLNEQSERDGSFLQPLMETYEHSYNIRGTRGWFARSRKHGLHLSEENCDAPRRELAELQIEGL